MTTTIAGRFPNADGAIVQHDQTPVNVTRNGTHLHFHLTLCGHGSVAMAGASGRGTFETTGGTRFDFRLEEEGRHVRYRLLEGNTQVATGILHDLPP